MSGLEMLEARAVQNGIPISGMAEITARCNLSCSFCYVADRNRRQVFQEIAGDMWLKLIREAVGAGMLMLSFTGGEPFLRGDFEELYCRSHEMGLRLGIFTNATLVGEREIGYLKRRPPALVSVSLYGAGEESYRKLCASGAGYEQAMAGLRRMNEAGLRLEVKTLPLRALEGELEAIGQVAAELHCPGKMDSYIGPGRDDPARRTARQRIPARRLRAAMETFRNAAGMPPEEKREPFSLREGSLPGIPCRAGKSSFFITYDGRLLGCSALTGFEADPFRLGFLPAWKSLQEQLDQAEPCEDCFTCRDATFCSMCPASRLSETGSVSRCSSYLKALAKALRSETAGAAIDSPHKTGGRRPPPIGQVKRKVMPARRMRRQQPPNLEGSNGLPFETETLGRQGRPRARSAKSKVGG